MLALKKNKQQSAQTNNVLLFTFKKDIHMLKTISDLKQTGLFKYVKPDYIGFDGGKKGKKNQNPSQQTPFIIDNGFL
ncbi:hypothetical protein [Polaribacter sp. IC066]|uniref:hypothetical protein n=1 Tax=Polaribacter sp. IC066 TaxID=57032 RepID=UPI001CC20D3A|nr:hypothetical protein [Polaribacter sp. IC066]